MIDPTTISPFDAAYLIEDTAQISDIEGFADEFAPVNRFVNVWSSDSYHIDILVIRRLADNKLFTFQIAVDNYDDTEEGLL